MKEILIAETNKYRWMMISGKKKNGKTQEGIGQEKPMKVEESFAVTGWKK